MINRPADTKASEGEDVLDFGAEIPLIPVLNNC